MFASLTAQSPARKMQRPVYDFIHQTLPVTIPINAYLHVSIENLVNFFRVDIILIDLTLLLCQTAKEDLQNKPTTQAQPVWTSEFYHVLQWNFTHVIPPKMKQNCGHFLASCKAPNTMLSIKLMQCPVTDKRKNQICLNCLWSHSLD